MPKIIPLPWRAAKPAKQSPRAFLNSGAASIDIYGDIGGCYENGITSAAFIASLRAVSQDTIELRINSGGGDYFDGVAIYNDLIQHPAKKRAMITGMAGSCASLIAMAADEIVIAPSAQMMIHNAWCWMEGNAAKFERTAADLRQIDVAMCQIYADRTGISENRIKEMMDRETWLTAQNCVDLGFADSIAEPAQQQVDQTSIVTAA